jgi:hypothetical protein
MHSDAPIAKWLGVFGGHCGIPLCTQTATRHETGDRRLFADIVEKVGN